MDTIGRSRLSVAAGFLFRVASAEACCSVYARREDHQSRRWSNHDSECHPAGRPSAVRVARLRRATVPGRSARRRAAIRVRIGQRSSRTRAREAALVPASVAARKAGPHVRPCDYRQGSPSTYSQFVDTLTTIPLERLPGSAAAGALRCAPALSLQHARLRRPGCHPRAQSAPGPRDRCRAADFRQRELLNRASRPFERATKSARV